MTTYSMTGFATASEEGGDATVTVDVKSVNAKGLDVKVRIPSEFDGLDLEIKKQVSGILKRGSVMVSVRIEKEQAQGPSVDAVALERLLVSIKENSSLSGLTPPTVDGLLAVRGIVTEAGAARFDTDIDELRACIKTALDVALDALLESRKTEGQAIAKVLLRQLDELEDFRLKALDAVGPRESAIQSRYQSSLTKIQSLKTPVSEDRLAQELALLAVKLDVTEEIDRLEAHIAEARNLLGKSEAVGRRLDFLCQELNREANTLCSKASDVSVTRIGLDMKALIDQFREQIQNIE